MNRVADNYNLETVGKYLCALNKSRKINLRDGLIVMQIRFREKDDAFAIIYSNDSTF